jgi:hypothetical protein
MNWLMSDIIRSKRLSQEEHQALKRIGKTICSCGFDMIIRKMASGFSRENEDHANVSETEALGRQFLDLIELYSSLSVGQGRAHMFLVLLHEIALNIQ